ncbi:hypothetical protein J4E80_006893 [Alternaria sp. BMP 0032]|nr:hypothetical protein J4E80_006893 [Alternaria sp. BMP 0032]
MSSTPSSNQQAALKMRPVTGAFLLKQRPVDLFHGIKDIIKNHGVTLPPSCSQDLKQFLDEKLEPYSLPYDPKRPNLQADLDNSARLRERRAQLKDQGATSKSFRPANPDKNDRDNTGPRNIHESFMDVPWNIKTAPTPPSVRPSKTASKLPRAEETANHDTVYRKGLFDPVANRVHPPYGFSEAPVKVEIDSSVARKAPTKAENFEHGPEGVNDSFNLHHKSEAFATLLPQVDQSVYEKTSLIRERADDYLDVGEEKTIERAPLAIAKDDLVKVEDSVGSDVQDHDQIHRTVDSKSPPAPAIKSDKATITNAKRTLNAFEEMDPDAVSFTSDNLDAIKKTRPAVKQVPSPAPAIKVEDATSGFQSSVGSSNSSGLQFSVSGVKQEFQETPDTTYFGESQQTLGRSQSPFSQTQGFPNSFPRSRFGSQSFLSPPGSATSQTSGRVEINPRRSARLSQAKTTAADLSAPSASAPSAPPAPSPTPSSASSLGVKRRRSASLSDEVEQVERQGRNKKFVTKEVVAKQREARHKEDAKDQKRSSAQRRTSVLRRRQI